MNIDDKDVIGNIDNCIKKVKNNIYLNNSQIDILNKYNIDYMSCVDIKELIFLIEQLLNDNDFEDLERVSNELSEYNYYYFTDK